MATEATTAENLSNTPMLADDETARAAVEAKVRARQDELFGVDGPSGVSDHEKSEDEDETADAPVKDEGKEELEGTGKEELVKDDPPVRDESEGTVKDESVEDDPPAKEAAEPTSSPTLPDAYRRSAIARSWTNAEIDEHFESNPELALRTFGRIHESRVAESQGWAHLGREAKVKAEADAAAAGGSSEGLPAKLAIDRDALVDKYGNEEIVDAIMVPVQDMLDKVNAVLPGLQEGTKAFQRARENALAEQIEMFFGGLKPFKEFYGTTALEATDTQNAKRDEVLELADRMISGAKMQGRKLAANDALDLAHSAVSRDFQEQAIRADLKTRTKTRSKGRTERPTARKGPSKGTGGKVARGTLVQRVGSDLKKIFST